LTPGGGDFILYCAWWRLSKFLIVPGGGCLNFSYAWWRQNNNLLWLEEPSEFICAWWRQNNNLLWLEEPSEFICAWWRLIHYFNKCLVEAYGCVWFLNNAMPGGGYIHNFYDGLVEAYNNKIK